MKVRTGFVSNSSSTAFIFCWKSDQLDDLFQQIRLWNQYFHLYADHDKDETIVTSEDVCEAMDSVMNKGLSFDPDRIIGITPIANEIQDLHEFCTEREDEYKTVSQEKDSARVRHELKLIERQIMRYANDIDRYTGLLKKGFISLLEFTFGDNHGDVGSYVPTIDGYNTLDEMSQTMYHLRTVKRFAVWKSRAGETWDQFAKRVGTIMDYEGRYINIRKPGLHVFTEQRR